MHLKLQQLLALPPKDTLDTRAYFDFCSTVEDIREVIRQIPSELGEFELLMVDEREGYFMIQNFFEKDGKLDSQIVSYDFYSVKEDLYYDFGRR